MSMDRVVLEGVSEKELRCDLVTQLSPFRNYGHVRKFMKYKFILS